MAAAKFTEFELDKNLNITAPPEIVEIRFGGNKVDLGKPLTPTQVKDAPTHIAWPHEAGALYTLIFTDPDVPSRTAPDRREFQHGLWVNIPGNDLAKGDTLAEYIGSGPPDGSGLHRYAFLVFKQSGRLDPTSVQPFQSRTTATNRIGFSTAEFVKKHGLGKPIAGNFYQAEYDDYVPTLHAQLGFKPPPKQQ